MSGVEILIHLLPIFFLLPIGGGCAFSAGYFLIHERPALCAAMIGAALLCVLTGFAVTLVFL